MNKPTYYYKTVYDIEFEKIKELGIKYILCDLDNTLISFNIRKIEDSIFDLINKIKSLDINFYIISNNYKKRVQDFCTPLGIKYLYRSKKPKTKKILEYVNLNNIDLSKSIFIGDQVLTDIKLANKLNIPSILVDSATDSKNIIIQIQKHFNNRVINFLFKNGEVKKL